MLFRSGTLTGDRIALEYYMDVLGNESQQVLDFAYLNSLYHTGVRNHLDDAILTCRNMPGHGDHFQALEAEYRKLDEFPFDYDRKLASILVKQGEEKLLLVKGSTDAVCSRCSHVEYRGQRSVMADSGHQSQKGLCAALR